MNEIKTRMLKSSALKLKIYAGMVIHAFDLSTQEAEADRSLRVPGQSWSCWVPGQPGLHREALSQKPTGKQTKQVTSKGAGQVAQELRATAVLARTQVRFPAPIRWLTAIWSNTLLWPLQALPCPSPCMYTHKDERHTHKIKQILKTH